MPRTPTLPLTEFTSWMREEKLLEPRTSHVYASNTRRVLEGVESIDLDAVKMYFTTLCEANKNKYLAHKAAWGKFVEWSKTERGVNLPNPAVTLQGSLRSIPALPLEVREAVWKMMRKSSPRNGVVGLNLHPSRICGMKWKHVQVDFPSVTYRDVQDPTDFRVRIRVPKSWLAPLEQYARAEGNGEIPLIPLLPGSEKPYPVTALKREYKSHKQFLSQS